jgi:signal transduction histidine kinase
MMPKSVSLAVQLLMTLVGLVVVTTFVLTVAAYRSFHADLEGDALRLVRASAEQAAGTVTRLVDQRHQRASGFLKRVESLCGETTPAGGTAWELGCVGQALAEYRNTEHARGALFEYGRRRIAQSGERPRTSLALPGSFARIVDRGQQEFDYVITAINGASALTVEFSADDLDVLFRDHAVLGADGEIFLTDAEGHFLTTPRYGGAATPPGATVVEPVAQCLQGAAQLIAIDYRGVKTIHGIEPAPEFFGGACIDAHLSYDKALAPAETLLGQMVVRGLGIALLGVMLSLIASRWIAAPVRRLALSARALEQGDFDRPIPVAGPSEIRALARAFAKMTRSISSLVAREQVARHEAEAANRTKDEFLATVSHELRNPLAAIMGWAELFRFGQLAGDAAQHAVEAIERAAHLQARLVEDLLDVSRIVAGRMKITRSAVSILEPTEAAIESVRPEADKKEIVIEYDVAGPIPPLLGDAGRLQQIVGNLLTNAIKFTPPHGHISVRLGAADDTITLSVVDDGEGIAADFLPHVFERFRQADALQSGGHSGLGIGLAIVHYLVKAHGGVVSASSDGPGHGSRFAATFPALTVSSHSARRPVLRASAGRLEPRRLDAARVLLIDDDPETLRLVREVLENAGASVTTASSAAEARDALAVSQPMVLVSDIAMPKEDGWALMRSLRASNFNMPAIALTAFGRRRTADAARAAGFQLFMEKPVRPDALVNAVASLAYDGPSAA